MTCKYLTKTMKVLSEMGGVPPRMIEEPACALGRQPAKRGWVTYCKEIPEQGPCWWWVSEQSEVPDPAFQDRIQG